MRTIDELIQAAGGPEAIAAKAPKLTAYAPLKWRQNGIPEKHWLIMQELADATVDELWAANQALRCPQPQKAAS